MKSDSAKVAHVDVRVALSKSLPQSSDKGAQLCETFPAAVELVAAVTSAGGLVTRRCMWTLVALSNGGAVQCPVTFQRRRPGPFLLRKQCLQTFRDEWQHPRLAALVHRKHCPRGGVVDVGRCSACWCRAERDRERRERERRERERAAFTPDPPGVRIFSIDGCHSARTTRIDLHLAAASLAGKAPHLRRPPGCTHCACVLRAVVLLHALCRRRDPCGIPSSISTCMQVRNETTNALLLPPADGGVVILDDVFNADWPEVYLGLALHMEGYLYDQLQVRFNPLLPVRRRLQA